MRRTFLSLTALLIGCVIPNVGSAEVEVRLIDRVAVRAPDITLGEIAIVEGIDSELCEQLRKLSLGITPRTGQSRIVSAYTIRSLLQKHQVTEPIIHGLQSSVTTETKDWAQSDLQQLVKGWILSEVDSDKEVDIDFLQFPAKWKIPAGNDVMIHIDAGRAKLQGPVTLTLRAQTGDTVHATKRVRVKLSLYVDAPVLIRPVRRGEKLAATDIEIRRTEVTKATGMEIAHPDAAIGLVAKRDLRIGSMPSIKDFDQPVVIERGTQNRIVVVNGSVKLSVTGAIALRDGRKGDLVPFKNPMNARETLSARVIRPGLALMRIR